jgi:hypothetical protein
MKHTLLLILLLLISVSAQALPLVSVKEQIREELWHQGLKQNPKITKLESEKKTKPRLNEELYRALVKYQL